MEISPYSLKHVSSSSALTITGMATVECYLPYRLKISTVTLFCFAVYKEFHEN
jgi:hypothetical protein